MVALGVLATYSDWADILHIASVDQEASHIFLVLPVAAWLVYVRLGRFRHCQPRGMILGPVLVAIGWLMSMWGFYRSIQSLRHAGAVLVVVGCLLSVLGTDILMRFFPAFAVLAFLVPIPGTIRLSIAVPLQTATAVVTQSIFDVLGEPVERSGNQLSINDQAVSIVEACNGMRMVFALVLVSYAFAFGEPLRNYVRWLILAASPLSAILCNVIRMVPTLWLYGYGNKKFADNFHDVAGWVMLVVAFLLLMSITRLLRWALIPVTHYALASD
jgi:exosortase